MREARHGVVRLFVQRERAEGDRRGVRQHEGVAVGRGRGDLRAADGAASAGLVVHDHGLPELLRELLGHQARQGVAGAPWRESHNDLDRLSGQCRAKSDPNAMLMLHHFAWQHLVPSPYGGAPMVTPALLRNQPSTS